MKSADQNSEAVVPVEPGGPIRERMWPSRSGDECTSPSTQARTRPMVAWRCREVGCDPSAGKDDLLAVPPEILADITDRHSFLLQEEDAFIEFRKHARTDRPLGSESFLADPRQLTGRVLRPRRRGPKPTSQVLCPRNSHTSTARLAAPPTCF